MDNNNIIIVIIKRSCLALTRTVRWNEGEEDVERIPEKRRSNCPGDNELSIITIFVEEYEIVFTGVVVEEGDRKLSTGDYTD